MKNRIFKLSDVSSTKEFETIFKTNSVKLASQKNVTFPSVEIVHFSFEKEKHIDDYFLNISSNDFKKFLENFLFLFGSYNYNNKFIYNELKKGIIIDNKEYNLKSVFNLNAIQELSNLWDIKIEEAYLSVINSCKKVLGKNGKLRDHRILGSSASNARRKLLGYEELIKFSAINILRSNLKISEDGSTFNIKLVTTKDINLIRSFSEYLNLNKKTVEELYKEIKLKDKDYLVLKLKDLTLDDFFKKYEATIKELMSFNKKNLSTKERNKLKNNLLKEIKEEMKKSGSSILFFQNKTTNYYFDESKINKSKNVLEKIELEDVSGYNVYKDLKTGELITFNENDAYKKLYDDRAIIFKNILTGDRNNTSEDVKDSMRERIEHGYDSDKFKSFHIKATKNKNNRETEIKMLKETWMMFFEDMNLPKGSYDKRNEYALNYLLLKYKEELGYSQAFQQLVLRCLSENSVRPDNACIFDSEITFFDLKTSYINKAYQNKAEKELLVLLSAYDRMKNIIENNTQASFKTVSGSTEKMVKVSDVSNCGFFIHFGDKTEIISEKRKIINMVDFSYFEITLIFSDFVRLVTLEIKQDYGTVLNKSELIKYNNLKHDFINIMKRSFELSKQ